MRNRSHTLFIAASLLMLGILACVCGSTPATSPTTPTTAISPITLVDDLTTIDLCKAIPKEDMEAIMGRKVVSNPSPFSFYDSPTSSGCQFDAGKDSDKTAYYSYVVLTHISDYDNQPLYMDTAVTGLGQSAYFNNGGDTRQLWVKVNDQFAFVVANGDLTNEEGQKAIAQLMLAAITP